MAMTNLPAAVATFTVQDASGSKSQIQFHVPFASALLDVLGALDLLRPAVQLLTEAAIIGQAVTFPYREDAPGTPGAGSRVEEKGMFIWRTANGRTTRFSIPAIDDAYLRPSGAIDRANAGINAMVGLVTGVDTLWCGADGSDITSLVKAYQRFNSSTKNQLPTDA